MGKGRRVEKLNTKKLDKNSFLIIHMIMWLNVSFKDFFLKKRLKTAVNDVEWHVEYVVRNVGGPGGWETVGKQNP